MSEMSEFLAWFDAMEPVKWAYLVSIDGDGATEHGTYKDALDTIAFELGAENHFAVMEAAVGWGHQGMVGEIGGVWFELVMVNIGAMPESAYAESGKELA